MKIAITGSRTVQDRDLVYSIMDQHRHRITELLNGMALHWLWGTDPLAGGVDRFAHDWAVENDVKITPYIPDWKRGKGAGMMRNADMARECEACIAIWDGSSSGTQDMIKQVRFRDKPVYLTDLSKIESELPFE